jgi:hypothetical protein
MKTVYGWMLWLYPAPFRARFARDMAADFRDGYASACRGGLVTRGAFVVRAYADVVASILTEWSHADVLVIWRIAVLTALSMWTVVFVVAALEWPGGPATLESALQLFVAVSTGAALTIATVLRRVRGSEAPIRIVV